MSTSGLGAHALIGVLAIFGAAVAAPDRPQPTPVFDFQDPEIDESSGLLDLGDNVATVNDSGDGPVIYLVDGTSGATVGRTTYSSDQVVDVEALAPGQDGSVWVGDIGDNGAVRMSVAVYDVPRPTPGDRTVDAQRYELAYSDRPHDAEALLVHPRTGRLLVVTKGLFGGQVFAAPPTLDPDRVNVLKPVGGVDGMVTDGAFLPDGRHVVLRTYSSADLYDSEDWSSPASMALPHQEQGEGLAVSEDGRLLISSEGSGTTVFAVPLSAKMKAAMATRSVHATATPDATSPAAAQAPAADEEGGEAWVVGAVAAGVLLVGGVALLRRRAQRRSTT